MQKFRYIYRIENDNGLGPYSSKYYNHHQNDKLFKFQSGIAWNRRIHNISNGCPSPIDENEVFQRFWYRHRDKQFLKFGFINLDQLRSWFMIDELKRMEVLGLKIKKYKIKQGFYRLGDKQVVYNPAGIIK